VLSWKSEASAEGSTGNMKEQRRLTPFTDLGRTDHIRKSTETATATGSQCVQLANSQSWIHVTAPIPIAAAAVMEGGSICSRKGEPKELSDGRQLVSFSALSVQTSHVQQQCDTSLWSYSPKAALYSS